MARRFLEAGKFPALRGFWKKLGRVVRKKTRRTCLPAHRAPHPEPAMPSPPPRTHLFAFLPYYLGSPRPSPLPTCPPPGPATAARVQKAAGPPAGKGANVRAAFQGLPGLRARARWGHRVRCPPRPLRESPRGAGLGAGASPGSQGAWPRALGCAHGRGGAPRGHGRPRTSHPGPCPARPGKPDPPSRLWFPENP